MKHLIQLDNIKDHRFDYCFANAEMKSGWYRAYFYTASRTEGINPCVCTFIKEWNENNT